MRADSWEKLDLDGGKAIFFVLAVATAFCAVVFLVGQELNLGSLSALFGVMAASTAGYLLFTAPRRMVRTAAFRQTLEAPSFAAASNIYLKTTSSRSKTFLMLRAEEPRLGSFLADVRRMTLLGYDARTATLNARLENHVFSESARTVVDSVVGVDGRVRVEEGSEELDVILNSSGLDEETRLPILIAVSFFLPIMLTLFAAMAKGMGPEEIIALLTLEIVVLDLTLAVSGGSVGWGKAREP